MRDIVSANVTVAGLPYTDGHVEQDTGKYQD